MKALIKLIGELRKLAITACHQSPSLTFPLDKAEIMQFLRALNEVFRNENLKKLMVQYSERCQHPRSMVQKPLLWLFGGR